MGGGEGAGEGKESSGEARNWGQAKGFLLGGTPEDQAFLGDGSQGEVIGREQRGRCQGVEAERGLCWWRAGRHGGLRKRRGSLWGGGVMRGDWEIRRRGLRWGGNARR